MLSVAVAAVAVSVLLARVPLGGQRAVRLQSSAPALHASAPEFDCVDGPGRSVRCARLPPARTSVAR